MPEQKHPRKDVNDVVDEFRFRKVGRERYLQRRDQAPIRRHMISLDRISHIR